MENMERQKFDDAWQDAFKGAEQSPSENVWTGIDSKLTRAEGGTMKRRVIFYQRLAAASILFAVVFGSLTAYYVNEANDQEVDDRLANEKVVNDKAIAQDQLTDNTVELGNSDQPKNELVEAQSANEQSDNNKSNSPIDTKKLNEHLAETNTKLQPNSNPLSKNQVADRVNDNQRTDDQLTQVQLAKSDNNERSKAAKDNTDLLKKQPGLFVDPKETVVDKFKTNKKDLAIHDRNFAALTSKDIPSPDAAVSGKVKEVTIIRKLPAMPASMMADSRKGKNEKENLWASIGASAGNYSAQVANQPAISAAPAFGNLLTTTQSATPSNSVSKGTAYSVGVNVAKKVSERWIVLGGLNYLNQATDYTSNLATISASNKPSAYAADYASKQSNLTSAVALTSPYQINSVNELVSVPVQAGYLIVNRKVGVQINSGVATDIFLQNTLTDKSGQLNKFSESAGSDSPYRSLSWSAIMGSELSYKIGDQYRVSLVPGVRYSMSPVLKSNSASSNPMIWDLGFRFRYIFR
jgi:hypothetical protein